MFVERKSNSDQNDVGMWIPSHKNVGVFFIYFIKLWCRSSGWFGARKTKPLGHTLVFYSLVKMYLEKHSK